MSALEAIDNNLFIPLIHSTTGLPDVCYRDMTYV